MNWVDSKYKRKSPCHWDCLEKVKQEESGKTSLFAFLSLQDWQESRAQSKFYHIDFKLRLTLEHTCIFMIVLNMGPPPYDILMVKNCMEV